MKNRLLTKVAIAGWLALISAIPAYAQSGCVKEVFHKYCLGGNIEAVLAGQSPIRTSQQGGTTTYAFADIADNTVVTVVHGRIATVARSYRPYTQHTYDRLREDLRRLYGEPTRTNPGGRMVDMWDQGPWRVSLVWNQNNNIQLIYRHERLQERARDSKRGYPGNPNPSGF